MSIISNFLKTKLKINEIKLDRNELGVLFIDLCSVEGTKTVCQNLKDIDILIIIKFLKGELDRRQEEKDKNQKRPGI